MPVKINGSTSGSVTLAAPATGTDVTLTLPGSDATVATLANPTFTGNVVLPSTTTIGSGTQMGAWTSYTPTWVSGLTAGNGTTTAKYIQIGKLVIGRLEFVLGSTSSISGSPYFSPPASVASGQGGFVIGRAQMYDSPAGQNYLGLAYCNGTNIGLFFENTGGTYNTMGGINGTNPFTWGTGDSIQVQFTYEAA